MGKYFLAKANHAKARELLELRQGAMTVLVYVAKFTELARFRDDYVDIDMAKVRKFEDGLKLSIRVKIVGFLLKDMDSMVRTAMVIKREIDDAKSIQDAGASGKRKESQPSSSTGKKQRTSPPQQFQGRDRDYQSQGQVKATSQTRPMTCYYCHQLGHMK